MIFPAHSPTTTLLLLAVNVPLAVLVGVLLVSDYRREMRPATDVGRVLHRHTGPFNQRVTSNHDDTISGRGADIRHSVRGEALMQISVLLALASLTALIIDFVLVYLIARPTRPLFVRKQTFEKLATKSSILEN